MATHNGSRFITEALDSVFAQTYQNVEVIIVDDASVDGVGEVIHARRDARIQYMRSETHLRLSAALNRGIAAAQGEFIARIDDDDVWVSPDKLARQVALLLARPRVGVCGTHNIVIDESGVELYRLHFPLHDSEIRRTILRRNPFPHSGVLVRKAALLSAGGYHENLFYAQDYHLWLKIGTSWELANLLHCYIKQRVKAGSLSNANNFKQWQEFMWAAWRFRRHYPGFVRDVPLYGREFVVNLFPKKLFFHVSAWKRERLRSKS
ncbi:MAG TPA: glycosyltransferase [Candidatus Andersenbacteria bacterium]|nr:glycosyltransferase [Candidatus Andersenbacteria bacterium]